MPVLALSTVCPSFLRPCKHSAAPNPIKVSPLAPSRNTYVCHPATHFSSRCRPARLRTCSCRSQKVRLKACLFRCPGGLDWPSHCIRGHFHKFAACSYLVRHQGLACMQGLSADSSVSHGTRPGRATGHRHALFNDFNLTEPFGIVNAAAGIVGLFFKVVACLQCCCVQCAMVHCVPVWRTKPA